MPCQRPSRRQRQSPRPRREQGRPVEEVVARAVRLPAAKAHPAPGAVTRPMEVGRRRSPVARGWTEG
eukprot:9347710-Alexandrium_andersonii.AAC.1